MNKKHSLMILALLCAVVQGAWADGSFGGGDGSAKNPYIINTTAQWDQFASEVNGGNTYSGMYFQLGDDITVSTMVGAGTTGKNAKPFSGTFDGAGHTLTFNHTATSIEAGKPYIIKWDDGDNIVNPTFTSVTIDNTASTTVTASNSGLHTVQFIGSYAPVPLDGGDQSNLYLVSGNKLYYPSANKTINAFRGYFHVDLTGSVNAVRAFVLNFGDEETTGIISTTNYTNFTNLAGAGWYTVDGRKLSGKPTKKGVYIQNGRKLVIK